MGLDCTKQPRYLPLVGCNRLVCYSAVSVDCRLGDLRLRPYRKRDGQTVGFQWGVLRFLWVLLPCLASVRLNLADDEILNGVTRLQCSRQPARLLTAARPRF